MPLPIARPAVKDTPDRVGIRAVLLDEQNRILLAKSHDKLAPSDAWWECPGGGIEDGEKPLDALAREVREETGYVDLEIGPEIWHMRARWVFQDRSNDQADTFHLVRLRSDDRVPATAGADEGLEETAWFTLDELAGNMDMLVPVHLVSLLSDLFTHGVPDKPIRVTA